MSNSDYQVLELSPTADVDTVKRKYRELSKRYHPDKTGGDDTKMKQLVESYNKILTLNELNGDIININLTLADVCTGYTLSRMYSRIIKCNKCVETTCVGCNGRKIMMQNINMGFMNIQQQVTCNQCAGSGSGKCGCNNREQFTVNMNIPVGCHHDMIVNTDIQGDYIGGGKYNQMKLKINVLDGGTEGYAFKRNGNNLSTEIHVSLAESLCGFTRELVHPSRGNVVIVRDKIVKDGDTIVVANHGVPFFNNANAWGSLEVVVRVNYKELSPEQKTKLREILG